MTVASHGEWSLLEKTELGITGISLDQANLSEVAKTVARTLSLPPEDVYVIDARERLLTLDILRTTVDPYSLVGRERELLTALAQLPGVRVGEGAAVRAEGMLGWIATDAQAGREALDRSRDMAAEIERAIASRALVFSTGNEVVSGNIEDTNKPWIVERLRQATFRPTPGPNLPDDTDLIAASFREAAEELGFGLIISTGGVGAETKDGTVEALLRLPCPIDLRACPDGGNVIADNHHRAVLDHAPLRVHGDHVARAPDPVGGSRIYRGHSDEKKAKGKTHRMVSGTGL